MKKPLVIGLCAAVGLIGCAKDKMTTQPSDRPAQSPEKTAMQIQTNPFFEPSPLQYEAPPFDRIDDEHYLPAIERGIAEQAAEIRAIADDSAPADFANTIVALEKTGILLNRVNSVFSQISAVNSNELLRKVDEETAPKLAAHLDNIALDPKLFARVKTVYDQRAQTGLDPESARLVERYYQQFVRAGALLSEKDKAKIRALNEEESKLTTKFSADLLKLAKDNAVIVDQASELEGLSAEDVGAAAEAAKARKLDGKWVLSITNTTRQPVLSSLKNRALRQRVWEASANRGFQAGENDTRPLVARLAELRAQRAALLGYPNWASFVLADQMAKDPKAVADMLTSMVPAVRANAEQEAAELQSLIDEEGGDFKLAPWDWEYYAEKLRRKKYELNEDEVRPYFELDRVLKDGLFYAMNRLFGITLTERKDLPVHHPDVRAFEVFDADGASIGLFYADYYARDSKRGGAWMSSFVNQSGLLRQKPVISNALNIKKPAPGQPTLLTFDEVNTLFHEFGHAVHGLFSDVQYPLLSGTSVPRDFVEFPSQFEEDWATEPTVIANYAKHYRTGEAIPEQLLKKIIAARHFNKGFDTLEYLEAALLDLEWHLLPEGSGKQDVAAFEAATLKKYGVDFPAIPPRYRSTYFAHVWPGGYASGYYAYLWSEILAADAFAFMTDQGGLSRENGQRFRDSILSKGGSKDPMALYIDYRGQKPSTEALLLRRGIK